MSSIPPTDTNDALERQRHKLERQRLALDVRLKRRELASKRTDHWYSSFSNPLVLAVVGGFLSIIASIVATGLNAYLDREKAAQTARENQQIEAQKARFARVNASEALQSELIKKFVEGPSVQRVRQNLTFLADAGLIPSYEKQIRRYLAQYPESAPQVPASGSVTGIGASDGVLVSQLPASDSLRPVAEAVGRLMDRTGGVTPYRCSAFLLAPARALTVGFCLSRSDSLQLQVKGQRANVHVIKHIYTNAQALNFAYLALDKPLSASRTLRLSEAAPVIGQPLASVFFREDSDQRAVRSPDCKVLAVREDTFEYGCRTGTGSAGSPILSRDGFQVMGVHVGKKDPAGKVRFAVRADRIAAAIR